MIINLFVVRWPDEMRILMFGSLFLQFRGGLKSDLRSAWSMYKDMVSHIIKLNSTSNVAITFLNYFFKNICDLSLVS